MSDTQLFDGFDEKQITEYKKEALKLYDPKIVKDSYTKWKNYTQTEKKQIMLEGQRIYEEIVENIDKGFESIEIQACIERWRIHMNYFWTPNLEQLLEIATAYSEDERFRETFDKIDPRLAEFIKEAVTFYAKKQNPKS
jgi:hypothetical protein